jgi:hypothetical protein
VFTTWYGPASDHHIAAISDRASLGGMEQGGTGWTALAMKAMRSRDHYDRHADRVTAGPRHR